MTSRAISRRNSSAGRGVAAVQLVAHVQGALHQGFQPDAPRPAHCLGDNRRHDVLDEQQPLLHPVVVDAVVETAGICAFVEVAVSEIAAVFVSDREHWHRRGVDARERAYRAAVVASVDPQLSRFEPRDGLLAIGGQTLELHGADDRVALAAHVFGEGQRRSGGEDGLAAHPREMLDRGSQVHEHGLGAAQAIERRPVRSDTVDFTHRGPPNFALRSRHFNRTINEDKIRRNASRATSRTRVSRFEWNGAGGCAAPSSVDLT